VHVLAAIGSLTLDVNLDHSTLLKCVLEQQQRYSCGQEENADGAGATTAGGDAIKGSHAFLLG
jgi:hypothetical protein